MESIKMVVRGKAVFLLSGVRPRGQKRIEIESPEKLMEAARRDPDAVAFGFVSGHWVAAA